MLINYDVEILNWYVMYMFFIYFSNEVNCKDFTSLEVNESIKTRVMTIMLIYELETIVVINIL